MNIKFIFVLNKNNIVVVKKNRDNDVFKLKSFAFLKRIIFEIKNRIRIDKFNRRLRFISKRFFFSKARQISSQNYFFVWTFRKSNRKFERFRHSRRFRFHRRKQRRKQRFVSNSTIESENDKKSKFENISNEFSSSIEHSKKKNNIEYQFRRSTYVVFLLTFFNVRRAFRVRFSTFLFCNVFFAHVVTNSYLDLSNSWFFVEFFVFATKIRTSFLQIHNIEYSKIERKFFSVSLRLLKKIYNDTLKFKNLSKFFFLSDAQCSRRHTREDFQKYSISFDDFESVLQRDVRFRSFEHSTRIMLRYELISLSHFENIHLQNVTFDFDVIWKKFNLNHTHWLKHCNQLNYQTRYHRINVQKYCYH